MAMKHRLRSPSGDASHSHAHPDARDDDGMALLSPKEHPRPSHPTNVHIILGALAVALVIVLGALLISSSSFRSPEYATVQSANAGAATNTRGGAATKAGGLRTVSAAASDPIPFANLLATFEKGDLINGQTPLTGVYTLGKGHALTATANTEGITGSIQFPHVDLATVLDEEAINPVVRMQTMFGISAQGPGQQGINKNKGPLDTSFLSEESSDPLTKSIFVNSDKAADDRALLTRCGYKPGPGKVPNQDRALIANLYLDGAGENTRRTALLMGIFDGHGTRGHETSHYVALNLPSVFAGIMRQQKQQPPPLSDDNVIKQGLIQSFLQVDEHEPVKGTGGSTASVLLYPGSGHKVFIANAGDSTTLLASHSRSKGTSTIVFQNKKHKPHMEGERQRIQAAGGQVMIPPGLVDGADHGGELQESSRVVIPDPSGNPFGGLALAMSRSIGDFDGRKVGLIPEPAVEVLDVSAQTQHLTPDQKEDTEYFAVIASDGIYDMVAPETVAQYLGQSLYRANPASGVSPLEACERLIRESSRLWMKASANMPYRDDITLGVSKIHFVGV
ncbi:hypothetical protein ACHAXT_007723 [Thalassiosira profunda]